MRKFLLLIIIALIPVPGLCQGIENTLTVIFYNTENLYDTIDSPRVDDTGFTPRGARKWDSERYLKKISDLAKVVSSVNQDELPGIIGLAGIENSKVLQDLASHSMLKAGNYEIIHKDGTGTDGLEVAMLYRKDEFRITGEELIRVSFPFDSTLRTRDILHVYGRLNDEREIHIYVNHWVSRQADLRDTEPRRMYCAVALRRNIDLLLSRDSRARIIIMGDFNDEPTNKSLMNVLQATNKRKNVSAGEFFNLMYDKHNLTNSGTCLEKNMMKMFDQIIVSRNLLTAVESYRCSYDSGEVFKKDWMMDAGKQGIDVPGGTYEGNEYKGGPGDHFPVYVTFTK